MALASVLNSDCAKFSFDNCQPLGFGCAPGQSGLGFDATPGDGLSFSVRNHLSSEDDDVERKIELLHGTTTLAFKVSRLERLLFLSGRTVIVVKVFDKVFRSPHCSPERLHTDTCPPLAC